MGTTPSTPAKGGGGKIVGVGLVFGALIAYGAWASFTSGEGRQRVVQVEGAPAPSTPATRTGPEVTLISSPAGPPEARRYINDLPVPVHMPATGTSERFPVRRGQTTCPSEYPEEFGYRTRCHTRGTADSVTEVFNDGGTNCRNTDWVVYETTNGQAKDMVLNYVSYPETCPVE